MLDELKFPDINHLIPIEKKFNSVISKNLDLLIKIAIKVDEILIKGTLDAFVKIDSERMINIDSTKYREDAKNFVKIALGVSFAIGREYAETNPDNARSCAVIRNLSSVLLLDSTKKELLDLSQYAATPLTRLSWLLNHHLLVNENDSIEMIDSNISMCQDAILEAFQGGILSYFILQKTGDPDIAISQFKDSLTENTITPPKETNEIMGIELNKIWLRWDKYNKPRGVENKSWKFTEKVIKKIGEMIYLIGSFDKNTASILGEQVGGIVTKPFLMCYYIGYDLASGITSRVNDSFFLAAATEPIDTFVMKLLEILVGKRIISPENGRERVIEIARLTGEAANNICLLGIENFKNIGYK